MFGRSYGCSECDFTFALGWSHHAGGQFVVCTASGTHFVLGGGESCWRPTEGERLQFQVIEADHDRDTGVRVTVRSAGPLADGDVKGVGLLLFDDENIACPECETPGVLRQ